jgi:sirohydrochlorin ferrochelatase
VVAKAPVPVTVTDIVGPVAGRVPAALLDGLHRRLAETGTPFDAVVLAAAGTRDRAARATVELSARALGHRLRVPCLAAYASASAPTPGEAVAALQRRGARRVAMGTYFLAPGRLYDAAVESACDAGAVAAARPLGAASELVRLVLARVGAAEPRAVAA